MEVADKNGDGALDATEMVSFFHPEIDERTLQLTAEAGLKRRDLDGDGKLSLREFWGYVDEKETPSEEEEADFGKRVGGSLGGPLGIGPCRERDRERDISLWAPRTWAATLGTPCSIDMGAPQRRAGQVVDWCWTHSPHLRRS